MEPKTPALPPPGSHKTSGLGDVDVAAIRCPSSDHRWLPRVPIGAATLFRDLERSEWGLSEESVLVVSDAATSVQRADDGGVASKDDTNLCRQVPMLYHDLHL